MKKKVIVSFLAGILLSAAGFYYALRNVPFAALVQYMESVHYGWFFPAAAAGLFTFVLRAFRWQVILSTSTRLPFFPVFHPMMIGFMINTVLPGRVGELARPAILKKQDDVPFSLGITTVAAERVLDAIALIALFAWVMATVHIDPNLQIEFRGYRLNRQVLEAIATAMVRFCIVVILLIIAVSIPAVQRLLKSAALGFPKLLVFTGESFRQTLLHRFSIPLTGVIDNIAAGFSLTRYPVKLAICLGYSFLIWLVQAYSLHMVTYGSPGIDLAFAQTATVFVIICFFIALPSVPGFWGLWEAGGVFGMALFGVPAGTAAGFSLATHVVLMIPVLVVGTVSALVTGINIIQVSYREPAGEEDPNRG